MENGSVPRAVLTKYVKTLLQCRIGDANWGDGVSWGAKPYYDQLVAKMQEREILEVAKLLADADITSRLQFTACQANYRQLVEGLLPKVTNIHLARALDMILESPLACACWGATADTSRRYRRLSCDQYTDRLAGFGFVWRRATARVFLGLRNPASRPQAPGRAFRGS
jgi:hypothetical protein